MADIMEQVLKRAELFGYLSYMNADEPSVEMRKRIYNMYGDLLEYKVRPTEFLAGLIEHNIEVYKVVCSSTVVATLLSKMNEDPAVQLASGSFINNVQDANTGIKTLLAIGNELGFDTEYVYSVEELRTALSNFKYAEFKLTRLMDTTDKSEETPSTQETPLTNNIKNLDGEWEAPEETPTVEETPHTENIKNLDGDWEAPEDEEESSEAEEAEELKKALERVESTNPVVGEDFDGTNVDETAEKIMARDEAINKQLENLEASRKKKEVQKAVDEIDNSDNALDMTVVSKTVKLIMAAYDIMYEPLFTSTPQGVITEAGILSIKSDNSLYIKGDGKLYAQGVSNIIKGLYGDNIRELHYTEDITLSCINEDGTLNYNYIPSLQARNIFGVYRGSDGTLHRETNWRKFRAKLVKYLTEQIEQLMRKFTGNKLRLSSSLVELFTTSFIAEDFDVEKSIKLKMKSISIDRMGGNGLSAIGEIIAKGDEIGVDPSTIEIVDNSAESSGVHNTLIVMDKKQYQGEILFAYKPLMKLIESGGSIGLQHTLLGRDIKGRNVTYNFASPQQIVSLIIAGSGSGKGVVTLNILATFIACGCPTVYVDWKPDMSAMLWDLERKTGAKILSIDGLAGRTELGSIPVRNYGVGHSMPEIASITDKLNCIPYIKMFQIMVLCAKARSSGYNGINAKGAKMQFIFDEAQAMNEQLSLLEKALDDYLKENKPKKGETETAEYVYVKRLNAVIKSLFSSAVEFRNTTGRTGKVGSILLGQQSDCSAWTKVGALKKNTFGFLVGNCSMKMLGKDATDGGKYSMGDAKPAGNNLLGNMGYFALIPQALADKTIQDKIKVVKSFLVLNENDYDESKPGKFSSGMLDNIEDADLRDTLIENDFLMTDPATGNRVRNPLVGFQGLIEYLGANISNFDLNKNLSLGYEAVDELLSYMGITGPNGKYSCIEEYVFDCSYNSLFTSDELKSLITKGGTIDKFIGADNTLGENGEKPSFGDGATLGVMVDDDKPEQKEQTSTKNKQSTQSTLSEEDRLRQDLGVASSARTPQELEDLFAQGVINEVQKNIALNEMLTRQAEGRQPLAQEQTPQEQAQWQNTAFNQQAPQQAFNQQAPQQQFNQQAFTQQAQPTPQVEDTLTKEEIDKGAGDTISEILGMFDDSVVDTLNATAAVLVDMTYRGRIHPLIAEEVARRLNLVGTGNLTNNDFVNGNARHIPSKIVQEYVTKISNDGKQAMSYTGKNGETVTIDTAQTKNFINLNESNSMDASSVANVFGNPRLLMNTPKGAERYLKNLWKGILDKVISSGIPAPTITRVSLIGNMMSVNGKMVYLGGVLGGSQGLQLKDIVEFRTLFKKFPMIGELMIDEEMLQVALLEFGTEPLGKLFDLGRKLRFIRLMERNGAVKDNITRENMNSHELRSTIQRNTLRNNIALYCQNMKTDGNWDMDKLADNVWGLRLARGCMGNAGEAFLDKTKPKVGRAVFYSCAGVMFGAVGSVAWGISRAGKGLFGLSKGFRR